MPATTSSQPSRTLGTLGFQPDADRSFRFEMRSDRAAILPMEPNTGVSQTGGSLGGPTPSV